jgi:hypothetical protein
MRFVMLTAIVVAAPAPDPPITRWAFVTATTPPPPRGRDAVTPRNLSG